MAHKILVVDDDLDTLRLVGLMLERQGFEIVAASSGQQALALARRERPDLIVLDLMMPDIDGVQVARRLRADPETRSIFIVMFTARTRTEDKLEGFDAGADHYLTKPIQPRELIAHIRAVLGRGAAGAPDPARPPSARGALVGFAAPKGGLGLTTLAINTGFILATIAPPPVILADFRPGCGSLGLYLGLEDAHGLARLLALGPAAVPLEAVEAELSEPRRGLRLLAASADPAEARLAANGAPFAEIARRLRDIGGITLLDLGPALTPVHQAVLGDCCAVVVALEPVAQTIHQARLLLRRLTELGCDPAGLLPVLIRRTGFQLTDAEVQERLGLPVAQVIGAAPEAAYAAQAASTPLVLHRPEGDFARECLQLARRVQALAESGGGRC